MKFEYCDTFCKSIHFAAVCLFLSGLGLLLTVLAK